MKQDKYSQALMELGLTYLQAEVYLALVKFGKADAKTLASAANVARGDVYRVMEKLEELGLAEKIIFTPTTFQATPLKEGCDLLLQNKEQEYTALKEEIKETVSNLPEIEEDNWTDDQQFTIISSERLFQEKIKAESAHSTRSIDIVGDWKNLSTIEFNQISIHEKDLERGVKIRLITEKHEGTTFEKLYPSLFKYNRLFEIRYVTPPIPIRVAVYDQKRLILSTRTPTDSQVTPILWSNNPQLVNVITAFFDQVWQSAEYTTG